MSQHSRLKVEAARVRPVSASCEEFGPIANGILHKVSHLFPPLLTNKRAIIHRFVKRITEPYLSHRLHQARTKLVEPLAMHIDSLGAITYLPRIVDACVTNAAHRQGNIRVIHDDTGSIATKFQGNMCHVRSCGFHNAYAGWNTARNADESHIRVATQGFPAIALPW